MIQVRLNSFPKTVADNSIKNLAAQDFLGEGGVQQQQQMANIALENREEELYENELIDNYSDWVVVVGKKREKKKQGRPKWNQAQRRSFWATGDPFNMGPGYKEAVSFDTDITVAIQQPAHQQQPALQQPAPQQPAGPQIGQQGPQPQPHVQQQPQQPQPQPYPQPPLPPPLPQRGPIQTIPRTGQQQDLQHVQLHPQPEVLPVKPEPVPASDPLQRLKSEPSAVASPDSQARRAGILRPAKLAPQAGDSQILARLTKGGAPELGQPHLPGGGGVAGAGVGPPPPTGARPEVPGATAGQEGVAKPPQTTTPPAGAIPPHLREFDEISGSLFPRFGRRGTRRTEKLPEDVLHKYPDDRRKKK